MNLQTIRSIVELIDETAELKLELDSALRSLGESIEDIMNPDIDQESIALDFLFNQKVSLSDVERRAQIVAALAHTALDKYRSVIAKADLR
jgi:hypothetical protein